VAWFNDIYGLLMALMDGAVMVGVLDAS